MMLGLLLGLLPVFLMGVTFSLVLTRGRLNLGEYIGAAFPLGFGQLSLLVILFDMIGCTRWNPFLIIAELLVVAIWVMFLCWTGGASLLWKKVKEKIGVGASIKGFFRRTNLLYLVVTLLCVVWVYIILHNTLFYPTYDIDGRGVFDVVGYYISQEHTIRNLSMFDPLENPLIHNPGSCISYAPFLQVCYAYVYWLGAGSSKIVTALLFFSFVMVLYSSSRRQMSATASILLLLVVLATPKFVEVCSWSLTNAMLAVFASMGFIYACQWIERRDKEDAVSMMAMSIVYFSCSLLLRIEGFLIPASLGIVLLYLVFRKQMKFSRVLVWGICVLLPLLIWMVYQKIVGLSTENFFITRLFWDPSKAHRILGEFGSILSHRLYYGLMFIYAIPVLLFSVLWYFWKKEGILYPFVAVIISICLYGIFLYHIDYVWDTLDRVLTDSAYRYFLIYVPIVWYSIFSSIPVRKSLGLLESRLSFSNIGKCC